MDGMIHDIRLLHRGLTENTGSGNGNNGQCRWKSLIYFNKMGGKKVENVMMMEMISMT